ncbi:MAG: terpene cyclase/mutase family protein [Planctomycetes bacterium]|nr:terpene cyclase/mutase family protein [Planctomycetota bacterium]
MTRRAGATKSLAALGVLLLAAAARAPAAAGEAPGAAAAADLETLRAVERGLRWLADRQNKDGSWSGAIGFKLNKDYKIESVDKPHVGVTALAGIAFLAGGHLPGRGAYGENIERATEFITGCVDETSGFIARNGTRMYSHAFATLYLAEVAGMSQRADVRGKLQRAVDLIVKSQNQYGSWRYEPFAVESDMSITVCQLMALRAARNIGIKVPRTTIDRAVNYVRGSYVASDEYDFFLMRDDYYFLLRGSFKYQKQEDTRSSFALTAAGIASLYNAGVYSDDRLRDSLEILEQTYDRMSRRSTHYFYWYGHYYAVQAMYVAGDPWWSRYYERIRRDLLAAQHRDGNWENDIGPGDAFGTAVAAIILQVPYAYLPILQR